MSSAIAQKRRRAERGSDYGYANARMRGMRARLLDVAFIESLIATSDVNHLIQSLSETEYGSDVEEALIHERGAAAVDEALKRNMVRTFQKVLGFLNPEAAHLVETLLGRWDVFNLKTILRGAHMHLAAGEVCEGLLAAGRLSQVELEALATLGDMRAVVDTASTWGLPMAPALRQGYAAYARDGELAELELALDRYYTEWASRRLARRGQNLVLARKILGIQTDIMNLVTVFRLQKAGEHQIEIDRFFLSGGSGLSLEMYRELAGLSDVDEVLDRTRGTPYGKTLEEAAMKYLEENSIAVFERALEQFLVRRALSMGTGDPLGIGVAISYLWAKQNEITNLRIIVKGMTVGMPEDRVRGELIIV